MENATSRRGRDFRDDEKMRGKKIIAFCRRLLADLQTREKRDGVFSVPLVYSWIFPPSEAVERNFDAHGSGGETDPTSTSSLSGSLK